MILPHFALHFAAEVLAQRLRVDLEVRRDVVLADPEAGHRAD
jgi:hypothetical protein